ncbi:hypothetical protein AB0M54_37570 [Actinoplanes sp. NPDC051470]|uniref:hypothetical protein n=1 Tax=Actinoplanes sp. NPDC051470 TaxID=3157224 RepID=UPI003449798A
MAPPDPYHLAEILQELLHRAPTDVRQSLTGWKTMGVFHVRVSRGYDSLLYSVNDNWSHPWLIREADRMGLSRWDPTPDVTSRQRIGTQGAAWHAEQLILQARRVLAGAVSRVICVDCRLELAGRRRAIQLVELAEGRPRGVNLAAEVSELSATISRRAGLGSVAGFGVGVALELSRQEREMRENGFVSRDEPSHGLERAARVLTGTARIDLENKQRTADDMNIPVWRDTIRREFQAGQASGEVVLWYEAQHPPGPGSEYQHPQGVDNHGPFSVTFQQQVDGRWVAVSSDGAPAGITVPDPNVVIGPAPDADVLALLTQRPADSDAAGYARPDLRIEVPPPADLDATVPAGAPDIMHTGGYADSGVYPPVAGVPDTALPVQEDPAPAKDYSDPYHKVLLGEHDPHADIVLSAHSETHPDPVGEHFHQKQAVGAEAHGHYTDLMDGNPYGHTDQISGKQEQAAKHEVDDCGY